MLKYSEIRNVLYKSVEIQHIPDLWAESVPFFCRINNEETVAFLYWNSSVSLVIKQLIGINRETGEILKVDAEELSDMFGISLDPYSPIVITDCEKYYFSKDRYEDIFCELCNRDEAFSEFGQEALSLLKEIVGIELFESVFTNIADEYISRLS